jgi:hypothetical protein
MKSTNASHLERWLGRDQVETISRSMRGFYGPPIAMSGVPGEVYATGDGDFIGECRAGYEVTARDRARDIVNRFKYRLRHARRDQRAQLNAGFASLGALLTAGQYGKSQTIYFEKVQAALSAVGGTGSVWNSGNTPVGGSVTSGAVPGGTVYDGSTLGSAEFTPAISGDYTYFAEARINDTIAGNNWLLYDRLWGCAYTTISTSGQFSTGVPTRYTSTTPGAADYAGGNFAFVEVSTALDATAHNWTACTYTNQAGTTGKVFPDQVGVASAVLTRVDHSGSNFFLPLASGDSGMTALTYQQASATVTGSVNFVMGHPIAFMPCPVAVFACVSDGLISAMNLVRVFDTACLSLLSLFQATTAAHTMRGTVRLVQG